MRKAWEKVAERGLGKDAGESDAGVLGLRTGEEL